ncbi:hypothetical protein BAUCODRAFT_26008 [Baudoinia panamericana UAMH 10762]|uniref:Uncharacterized protein n=1 Tax=Baudoinia panamericana (strain UAMH 10762) TaxID=717646 RepID=M2N3Y7_BAUPA|nr:uncharacterized protein BAUCODRAFT_26008 [Baudoinia panamericana UAMH 10762]EMC93734.1 hypothetical protein BAUCODRAFT_26008 [Baudoinia panamericana UAMH 10762]
MADQVKYTQKLKDAKVLVIGGSSGIGYGVAEALVENGCIVTISASNPDRAKQTVDRLTKSYPSAKSRIHGESCNLGDASKLDDNIKALFERVGSLDHVINTAGDSLEIMNPDDITMDKIMKVGTVRFFAPIFIGKHAPKYLSSGPRSSITFTTGSVSEKPIANWSTIGAFATGLHGLTRGLALDLKPIRVNLISPGPVDTELWNSMSEDQRSAMKENLRKSLPTGRIGSVEDVVESFLYVMKDANITGAVVSTSSGSLLV